MLGEYCSALGPTYFFLTDENFSPERKPKYRWDVIFPNVLIFTLPDTVGMSFYTNIVWDVIFSCFFLPVVFPMPTPFLRHPNHCVWRYQTTVLQPLYHLVPRCRASPPTIVPSPSDAATTMVAVTVNSVAFVFPSVEVGPT